MIYKVDSSSLIGRYIPKAYVQDVILDKGSVAETLKDSGSKGHQTQTGSDNDTKCKLTISIKDVGRRWSATPRRYQDLKIKVVRSVSADVTREFISYSQPRALQILQRSQNLDSVKVDEISLGGMSRQEIRDRTTNDNATPRNNVGSVVFEYLDYGLPSRLGHLTYFVFVYSKTLEEEQNLGPLARDFVGMCYIQTVVNDGSVPKLTSIYTLKGAKGLPPAVWAGPVHRMNDGAYHTGARHAPNSRLLDKSVVSNTKIKDLRSLRKLQENFLSITIDQPKIFSTIGTPLSSKKYFSVTEKNALFTDLFSALDLEDNLALLFGINMRSLVARYSKFGSAVPKLSSSNHSTTIGYEDLLTIKGMRIKRRRVKPTSEFNSLFSHINGSQKFEKEEVDEVIYSTHSDSKEFSSIALDAENASFVKFYTGMDRGLQDINYGKYQYVVELEVADTSDVAIAGMVGRLQRSRGALAGALIPHAGRYRAALSALRTYADIAHTVFLMFGSQSASSPEEIYNGLKPMLESHEAQEIEKVIETFDSLIQDLRNLISMDSNAGVKQSSLIELRENIASKDRTSKAEPPTANIMKIEHVFQNEYDPSLKNGTGYDYLNASDVQGTQSGLAVIGKEQFLERVKMESSKFFTSANPNIGLVVNNKNYTNADSLQKMDVQFFTPARVKIFNSFYNFTDPPSPQNEKYEQFEKDVFFYNVNTQLTNAPPKKDGTQDCGDDTQRAINGSYSIFDLNVPERENQISFFEPDSCLGQRDLTLAPTIDEPTTNLGSSPKYVMPAVSPYLSGFLRTRALTPPPADDCSPRHCQLVMSVDMTPYNIKEECNDKLLAQGGPEREESLKNLPNQIKSMLLGSLGTDISSLDWMFLDPDNLDADPGPAFRINLCGLQKIEAMVGLETSSEGTVLSRMPRFVPLTRTILESIPAGSNLLCRLVSYTNKDFSLTGLPNNLKLPIYNKHFLIRGSAFVLSPDRPVERTPQDQTTMQTMSSTRNFKIENSSELEQYSHINNPPLSPPSDTVATTSNTTVTNIVSGGY
jgi:hypothetical protein